MSTPTAAAKVPIMSVNLLGNDDARILIFADMNVVAGNALTFRLRTKSGEIGIDIEQARVLLAAREAMKPH